MSESPHEVTRRADRQQDARHDALGRAMELHNRGPVPQTEAVIETAKKFEAFLQGQSPAPTV